MSKCKASEISRNEAYVKGIRRKAQGTKGKTSLEFPLSPAPHLYAAVTRDEGNAAGGRFQTASSSRLGGTYGF